MHAVYIWLYIRTHSEGMIVTDPVCLSTHVNYTYKQHRQRRRLGSRIYVLVCIYAWLSEVEVFLLPFSSVSCVLFCSPSHVIVNYNRLPNTLPLEGTAAGIRSTDIRGNKGNKRQYEGLKQRKETQQELGLAPHPSLSLRTLLRDRAD